MSSRLLRCAPAFIVALALLAGPAARAAADVLGRALSVEGEARVLSAEGAERSLATGGALEPGDRVVTGADGRVGVSLPDAFVKLEPDSAMRFARGAEGASDLDLERGRARVLDLRQGEGGAPIRIGTPEAAATVVGGDTEAYVLDEKAGRYAMLCDWAAPLTVRRGGQVITSAPPDCIVAKPDEALYAAPAHGDRLAVPAVGSGPLYGPISDLFPPIVATPPPDPSLRPPTVATGPPFGSCEVAGCTPGTPPPPPPPPPCNCARPPGGDPDPFGG